MSARRLIRFFLLALVIFGVTYAYLGYSLAAGHPAEWIVIAVPFLMMLALPLAVWSGNRNHNPRIKDTISFGAYASMGLLTYLSFFAISRDLIRWLSGVQFAQVGVWGLSAFALGAGALTALRGPRVKELELQVRNLPAGLDGFRIAQITDLHAGGLMTRAYVDEVVRRTNQLKADMVALTGDLIDGQSRKLRQVIDPLSRLNPQGRVFYVTGNHEYYWNIEEWLPIFRELGATVLNNQTVTLDHGDARVSVSGIPDLMGGRLAAGEKPDLAKAAARADGDFRILLSHRPGVARKAAKLGFDLQLSGHTHGGQFFPWTLVIRAFHEFHKGLHRVGTLFVYVSPGTGTWGPPLRLGTRPEITLIRLKRHG